MFPIRGHLILHCDFFPGDIVLFSLTILFSIINFSIYLDFKYGNEAGGVTFNISTNSDISLNYKFTIFF